MPFDPAALSGLQLHLKADALALADGAAVTSWTDSSANARHGTQATATMQPTFRTNVINGKPVIRFDGGDWLSVPNFSPSFVTIFAVAKLATSASGFRHIASLAAAAGTWASPYARARLLNESANFVTDIQQSGTSVNQAVAGAIDTNWHTFSSRWDGTFISLKKDGVLGESKDASHSGAISASTEPWCIGGRSTSSPGEYWSGDIAELLIYNRALTDDERTQVEQHLAAKYALTVPSTAAVAPALRARGAVVGQSALAAGTSLAIPVPAGAVEGDVLELTMSTGSSSAALATTAANEVTAANGWTVTDTLGGVTPNDHRGWVAIKRLTAPLPTSINVAWTTQTDVVAIPSLWDTTTIDADHIAVAPAVRHSGATASGSWASPTIAAPANTLALARFFNDNGTGRTYTADQGTEEFDHCASYTDHIAGYSLPRPSAASTTITATMGGGITAIQSSAIWALRGRTAYPPPVADTTAPNATITSPTTGQVLATATPTVAYTADEAGSTFELRVDGGTWTAVPGTTSGSFQLATLADGQHTVEVRATDPSLNTDATPASVTFTVDTTPPQTTITNPADGQTDVDGTVTALYTASEVGSTFQLRVDGGAWNPVPAEGYEIAGLADGTHTIEVRATDPAGNTDLSPALVTFTVATPTVSTGVAYAAPDETDDYLAGLPYGEAQAALTTPPLPGLRSVACGWHGTLTDPNRGAYAVVSPTGPLADLLGERIRVRSGSRSTVVYVTADVDVPEPLSLSRRAFLELAVLSTDELRVTIEVLS